MSKTVKLTKQELEQVLDAINVKRDCFLDRIESEENESKPKLMFIKEYKKEIMVIEKLITKLK